MIPVVIKLAQADVGLPLQPLAWAMAFGACLGIYYIILFSSLSSLCFLNLRA